VELVRKNFTDESYDNLGRHAELKQAFALFLISQLNSFSIPSNATLVWYMFSLTLREDDVISDRVEDQFSK
jgi:hypothetical protein